MVVNNETSNAIARNNKNNKTLLHLTMLTSIVAAAAFTSSSSTVVAAAAQDNGQRRPPPAIPFCDDRSNAGSTIGRRLLYVSTLDGRLSALDITRGGKLHWSIPTGPGPLVSSSIHRLELTNNGQFVRMIPSLSGSIYKFDGDSIDPIRITTDNLLSSSAKFSDDLVISGGKETRTYGVSARTGQLLYECSMHGCVNATDAAASANATTTPVNASTETIEDVERDEEESAENAGSSGGYLVEHDPLVDDVIVVRRQTQTVRAVESRTGVERWNFSVGQHELDLVRSGECHDRHFSELDMAILDLDVKVIVPEGVICAFSKSEPNLLLWKHKFDHPIVNSWKIGVSDELESIDMFGSAQWLWENDENMFDPPYPSISPSIYLGMYERQLYIQESVSMRQEIADQSKLHTHLTVTEQKLPKIPWRPIPASSNSLIVVQDDKIIGGTVGGGGGGANDAAIQGNELVPYDEDQHALSAQSVLNASEYVNGNGFYLYTRDDLKKPDAEALCDNDDDDDDSDNENGQKLAALEDKASSSGSNISNHTITDDLGFSLDDIDAPVKVVILSLWFWWKEIVVIAFTSAVLLNLFIGNRNRLEREIVVIERHIPVSTCVEATESSTAAMLGPPTGSAGSKSNGFWPGQRSLSESTSHSGEHFSSRFQGDFDLVRCLGRGGFGVVFEAKNKLDDCKYAVKRITLPNKKESRERVMREVKTLANCEHQNIVRFFQAWVETPPPGWQEEEDNKLLAHELSTSIQIETPDGTTLPSFASSLAPVGGAFVQANGKGKLQYDKKQQLQSWVSSVASTACSSDHEYHNGIAEENEDEDDDSCIVFRTESQSLALRSDADDNESDSESESEMDRVIKRKNTNKHDAAVSIDIHSNSIDLSLHKGVGDLRKNIDYSQLSDSFQIEFVRSANGEEDSQESGVVENGFSVTNDKSLTSAQGTRHRRRRPLTLDVNKEHNNNNLALVPATSVQLPPPKPQTQNKVYLYIQMQLCRKESLRDWLRDNRTDAREQHISSIFHQIVDAVDYVHLKGLIHRDLKPSNIFFSQDGQIKIGDFGLVTDMADIPNLVTRCGDNSGLPSCARHTQQVGTHLYMSPEQLRGQHYDFKVDIYSLGLIFFELLRYFGTEMERIVTLRDLRDGRYPSEFAVDKPAEYELLQLMLSPLPEVRPATMDLKTRLNSILQLPEVVGDTSAALADAARRLSKSRTFSSSE